MLRFIYSYLKNHGRTRLKAAVLCSIFILQFGQGVLLFHMVSAGTGHPGLTFSYTHVVSGAFSSTWLFSQHGLAELDFVRGDWILEVPTVEAARLPEGLCLELARCCPHQKHVSRPVQIQAEGTVRVWALAKVVYWGHQGTLHRVNQVLF